MFAAPVLYERYVQMAEATGLGVHPAVIFASIVLAPLGEELLCRGIIFNYAGMVTKGMKNKEAEFWVANAIQALMFGIMHANWIQGSFAFVIGLGLGWLRRRYNSLYPSMLAHLTVNFLSSFVMGYVFLDPTGESFQWFSAGRPGLCGSRPGTGFAGKGGGVGSYLVTVY